MGKSHLWVLWRSEKSRMTSFFASLDAVWTASVMPLAWDVIGKYCTWGVLSEGCHLQQLKDSRSYPRTPKKLYPHSHKLPIHFPHNLLMGMVWEMYGNWGPHFWEPLEFPTMELPCTTFISELQSFNTMTFPPENNYIESTSTVPFCAPRLLDEFCMIFGWFLVWFCKIFGNAFGPCCIPCFYPTNIAITQKWLPKTSALSRVMTLPLSRSLSKCRR